MSATTLNAAATEEKKLPKRLQDLLLRINHALEIGALDRAIELLGEAAREEGFAEIARKTGLNRSHFYRAQEVGGNPSLDLVMRICEVLGLNVQILPRKPET